MPKLGALVPDRAMVDVPFGSDVLHVVFNPQRIDVRFSNAAAMAQRSQVVDEELIAQTAELLVEWDLLDDDSGAVIPITADTLLGMPGGVLARIMQAISESPAASMAVPIQSTGAVPIAPVVRRRRAS